MSFEPLRQTAGRRAVLRDDEVYPVFRDAVQSVEHVLAAAIERIRQEVDAATADRLSDALRQVFGRVLKELADLDNPMRTLLGEGDGTGAVGADPAGDESGGGDVDAPDPPWPAPSLDDLEPRSADSDAQPPAAPPGRAASPDGRRRNLPSIAPDPDAGHHRSRFDPELGTVLYNEQHADFLLVKDDETALLDYLATLVAKEYVVYNNPRAASDDLAEELVRMLVRVRRHLPTRLRRR